MLQRKRFDAAGRARRIGAKIATTSRSNQHAAAGVRISNDLALVIAAVRVADQQFVAILDPSHRAAKLHRRQARHGFAFDISLRPNEAPTSGTTTRNRRWLMQALVTSRSATAPEAGARHRRQVRRAAVVVGKAGAPSSDRGCIRFMRKVRSTMWTAFAFAPRDRRFQLDIDEDIVSPGGRGGLRASPSKPRRSAINFAPPGIVLGSNNRMAIGSRRASLSPLPGSANPTA